MRRYRFFYHYRRQDKKMSVHFQGKCHTTDNIKCYPSTETKRNERQPYLTVQGFAKEIVIEDGKITII